MQLLPVFPVDKIIRIKSGGQLAGFLQKAGGGEASVTSLLNSTAKLDILNVAIISPELCAHYFLVIPILCHDSHISSIF